MRFRHPDGSLVHLAYCTNVHPAEDLDGVIAQLSRYARPVRERLGAPRLGVGLWLARRVADTLITDRAELVRLRKALDHNGLEVVTLNGFPYEGFQDAVVKHNVYHPDWTTSERVRYTLDLARVLTLLLPEDVDGGSVSTLPLAWRAPWTPQQVAMADRRRDRLNRELAGLAAATGRTIRVGFEPEPGCVVETTGQAVRHLAGQGVCLDACHLAVAFEDPAEAVDRLVAAGSPIVKLQASCALELDGGADREALRAFAEPRFLHQTRAGGGAAADDLDAALDRLPADEPWRVHFHVPLHAAPEPPLRSTRHVLEDALAALFGGERALTPHVEVETYTWEVLPDPPDGPDALADGIAAELAWTADRLTALGLKREHA
ncbi:metabolite traffic protein EboE [Actinomadura kijaniata]|uniref:Sugar phosphate isomerase/epimerase n=1 Tax=Actinomadura namibiensis TaxID=182080 RepID=A0A7W3LTM8_ACTNM|nr:metabolite traffic protein EboE [Actinomadura namibiensis]MBA8954106.1 sugar phosphate isomerase/epimerase [Actinomadura namibiensis]